LPQGTSCGATLPPSCAAWTGRAAAKEHREQDPNDFTQAFLLAPYAAFDLGHNSLRQRQVLQGVVLGCSSPLRLALITLQAFMSFAAAALSGCSVLMAYRWLGDRMLSFVPFVWASWYEGHLVPSIVRVQNCSRSGDNTPTARSCKLFIMKKFYVISYKKPRQDSLTFSIGKVSEDLEKTLSIWGDAPLLYYGYWPFTT
jgi:hypothetical protein